MRLFVHLALVAIVVSACQTTSSDLPSFSDGEQDLVNFDPEATPTDAVPSFLWSPSQRRANAGYHFLLAEYLSMKNEVAHALPLFESAYRLDPNPFLGGKLIATEAALGKVDEALPEARRMVLLYPDSSYLRLLHGRILASAKTYDQAVEELERSLELDSHQQLAFIELIEVYQKMGKKTEALRTASIFAKRFPQSVVAQAIHARLLLATGKQKAALVPARRAYEMQTSNPELILVYALALELNGKSREAVALYEQLYRLDPTNEELIGRMIDLYRHLGDLDVALDLLNELVKSPGGDKPGVHMQRAFVLWELKRFQDASEVLDQLAKNFPESDRIQYLSALGKEKLKKFDEALALYDRIPAESIIRPQADFRRIVILKTMERVQEARSVAKELMASEKAPAEVFIVASGLEGDQSDYDDAIAILKDGYNRYPDQHRLLFLIGVYQERAGDIEACIATMRRVIELDPSNSSAMNYLGYLFAERSDLDHLFSGRDDRLEEAEKLIEKALELKPGDGYYLDSLGWVYYQKGDYQHALETLKRALDLASDEAVILEHLSDVYLKLGDTEEAKKHIERAVKAKMDKRDEKRIRDKYKKLVQDL